MRDLNVRTFCYFAHFCAVFGVRTITQSLLAIFGKIRVPSSMARLSQLCLSDNHTRSAEPRDCLSYPQESIHPFIGDPVWSDVLSNSLSMYHDTLPPCIDKEQVELQCAITTKLHTSCSLVVCVWRLSSTTHTSFHFIFNFQFSANC